MFENEFTWGKAVAKNETEKFHSDFENAVNEVKKDLGKTCPIIINGKEINSEDRFIVSSPADRSIKIAEFPSGTKDDALNAISSAKNAFEEWSNTPYQKRADIFNDCADVFSNQKF